MLLYGGEGRYQHINAFEVKPDEKVEPRAVYTVRRPEHLADGLKRILDANGPAPLPQELVKEYVYSPDEITAFPQLVRDLAGNSTAVERRDSATKILRQPGT